MDVPERPPVAVVEAALRPRPRPPPPQRPVVPPPVPPVSFIVADTAVRLDLTTGGEDNTPPEVGSDAAAALSCCKAGVGGLSVNEKKYHQNVIVGEKVM